MRTLVLLLMVGAVPTAGAGDPVPVLGQFLTGERFSLDEGRDA